MWLLLFRLCRALTVVDDDDAFARRALRLRDARVMTSVMAVKSLRAFSEWRCRRENENYR